jgi:hypothetical protein
LAETKTIEELTREWQVVADKFKQSISGDAERLLRIVADALTIKMNNIMVWYHVHNAKAADTTEEILYSQKVRPGQMVVLTHVSAKNEDHANTTTRIAVERGGSNLMLNRDVQSAVNISIDWDGQVLMAEGDRVKVSFFGCTSADDVEISCSGYEIKA